MTERAEVEALLAEVNVYTGRKSGLIAELCHLWLAVQDAPVVELTECNQLAGTTDFDYGDMLAAIAPMKPGQRVRLVRDGGGS